MHYFAGELDDGNRAMSWCLWTDMAAAREALSGPAHQEAVHHAHALYETFTVELYDVHLLDDRQVIFDPTTHNH